MENTLLTRIQLKYDTLSNWNSSSFILKAGEVAVVEVPTDASNSGLTPPAIGIKVGNGRDIFVNLPWIQAAAGDVYTWAKQPLKPTYQASEISGLADYISGQIDDSNTHYRIQRGSGTNVNTYYLQSQELNSSTWTDISTIDFTDIYGDVNTLKNWANTGTSLNNQILNILGSAINSMSYSSEDDHTHQFVTNVTQSSGTIQATWSSIGADDITSGTLPVSRGGLGTNNLASGEVVIGNGTGAVTTKRIETSMANNPQGNLITDAAIKLYVESVLSAMAQTFSGAMHFIGIGDTDIRVGTNDDPNIDGFNMNNVQLGDVCIVGSAEYVWAGSTSKWQLLGDEGSFILHGSITDNDINGTLSQSKIEGLVDDLDSKVDKVTGMGLSQENYSNTEKTKLAGIEEGAEVNKIEKIYVNGSEQTITNKQVNISIDLSNVGQVQGARVPTIADATQYQDVPLDATTHKLTFNNIAVTGDVDNLTQNSGTVLVFYCGTATSNI